MQTDIRVGAGIVADTTDWVTNKKCTLLMITHFYGYIHFTVRKYPPSLIQYNDVMKAEFGIGQTENPMLKFG